MQSISRLPCLLKVMIWLHGVDCMSGWHEILVFSANSLTVEQERVVQQQPLAGDVIKVTAYAGKHTAVCFEPQCMSNVSIHQFIWFLWWVKLVCWCISAKAWVAPTTYSTVQSIMSMYLMYYEVKTYYFVIFVFRLLSQLHVILISTTNQLTLSCIHVFKLVVRRPVTLPAHRTTGWELELNNQF